MHFNTSVWVIYHRAKESTSGFSWVENINLKVDDSYCNFYPMKSLLSYPQASSAFSTAQNKARMIAYHFRRLMATSFVVYYEKQETVMCFHPGDLFPQFKKGPLRELTEDEVVLFMKKIEAVPEEKFWARLNEISRAYSDHGGLQTKAMSDEVLGADYFPEFEAADPSVAEGVGVIMKGVRDNPPPDLSDEWCCKNAGAFGVRTNCGLNWLHLCCFLNNVQWLKFIYVMKSSINHPKSSIIKHLFLPIRNTQEMPG